MIRRTINHEQEHRKSITILKKKGIHGLLVTEYNGEVISSAVGKYPSRSFKAIYQAILGTSWLHSIASGIFNPKPEQITFEEQASGYSPDDLEATPSMAPEAENVQMNG